jgi:phosphoglycerate dehydrogenase-like enzyme
MKQRLKLVVNVTRDKRVHKILENFIVRNHVVSGMFERVYVMSRGELLQEIPSADVLFSFAVPEEAIKLAANLKWLHFASAGVEKSFNPSLRAKRIKLSCSRGLHAAAISEYVLMQMLAFSKKLRQAYQFQEDHQWQFEAMVAGKFDLEGKTIAIIGLGSIGLRVAKLAKAFDMHVIGMVNRMRKLPHVNKIYPQSKIETCLKQADFVVLATPLTERTFHIIGERELSVMKPGAYLINIGRGQLIDEKALIEALKAKKIAGGALDVFDTEPLPSDSPLWAMDNVGVTPHVSGMAENLWEKVAARFCENAIRFKDGKSLIGTVNIKKGY